MITTQELAKRFEKFFTNAHNEGKSPAKEGDVKIPYKNLSEIWGGFEIGNCYTFFGWKGENALDIFRINLLWQLARNNTPVHILEGGKLFERDFEDLVMLQAKVAKYRWKMGFISHEQSDAVLEGIKTVSALPIAWHAGILPDEEGLWRGEGFKYPATLPLVCTMNLSLNGWHARAELLWNKAQERNRILLLFVQTPQLSNTFFNFDDAYLRNKIIFPEKLCSHMGYVKWNRKDSHILVRTKETESLIDRVCLFDRQGMENPLEEKEL